jgi:DNA (cytosine-5)-methyltransferase 1
MTITQLDLFSGIGGFHLGFEKAGYKVKSYFSEVDKHAVAVYKHKFKDAEYVGSVTDVRGAALPTIDLITFGSPCQDFSLAGKRKGMGGERSSLILEAIRLIGECRPGVFIWENVKGTFSSNSGEDFAAILQAFANIGGYRLEWQLLNTSWFLPQNRERIYLVGYSTNTKRNWRGVFPIGGTRAENNEPPTQEIGKDITHTICSSYSKFTNDSPVVFDNYNFKWREDGNIGTLTSHSGKLSEGFKIKEVGDFRNDEGWRPRKDGLAPCLATRRSSEQDVSTMPPILKIKSATKLGYEEATEGDSINLSNPNSETRRGRVGKQKANTLETSCNQAAVQDYRIRRLTPIECERLQGFPDNHTEYGNYDGEVKEMSNTQRYKQCGNAVTTNVVQAIAEKIKPLFK